MGDGVCQDRPVCSCYDGERWWGGDDGGQVPGAGHLRRVSVQSELPATRFHPRLYRRPDLRHTSETRPVRAVHLLRLPVLRLRLQHDGWTLHLLHRLPPPQGRRGQEEGGVDTAVTRTVSRTAIKLLYYIALIFFSLRNDVWSEVSPCFLACLCSPFNFDRPG